MFDETFQNERLTSRKQKKIIATSILASSCPHTDAADDLLTERPPVPFCPVVKPIQFLVIFYTCQLNMHINGRNASWQTENCRKENSLKMGRGKRERDA